jgi:branched-chain amino acid transport system substrate-binding protein
LLRKSTTVLAVLAIVALAACSSSKPSTASGTTAPAGSASSSKTPFLVLSMFQLTAPGNAGPAAKVGQEAAQAAANVLNANGGILGHQVKLENIDDAGNVTNGVGQLQQRLLQGPKPDMIIPGTISTQGVAYVPVANQAGIISAGTPSAIQLTDPTKYPNYFSMPPSQIGIAQEEFTDAKAAGATKVGVISGEDAFGESWATAAKQASQTTGLPASFETYADTALDMTPQLQRLQSAGSNALFVQGFGAPVGSVLQSRVKLGWNVPIYCESTCAVTDLVTSSLVGTPAEANLKVQLPVLDVYSPPSQASKAISDYIAALKAIGPITLPLSQNAFNYDALMVIAQAAQQANSIATPDLDKAMENLQQPANPKWVTLKQYHWTSTSHAATGSGKDYPLVTPTHLVDGQVGAPGA